MISCVARRSETEKASPLNSDSLAPVSPFSGENGSKDADTALGTLT